MLSMAQPERAYAVEWEKVAGTPVILFYPAQMSWEILLSQAQHTGANRFKRDRSCRQCHEGGEVASGELLVAEKKLEPAPIANKPGAIVADVKMAHEGEHLYVRVAFPSAAQPNAGMDPKFEAKVAVMFSGQNVREMARGGCFAACHVDLPGMPLGANSKMTMYLPSSRGMITRAGGNFVKSEPELSAIRQGDGAAEYWQAGLGADGNVVVTAGSVLDRREPFAAHAVSATATKVKGEWVVTFRRALAAKPPHKQIVPDTVYTVGFSIHAGHTAGRFHYVSLEKTFGLGPGLTDFEVMAASVRR
jgi:cytochrome c-type protein NapC